METAANGSDDQSDTLFSSAEKDQLFQLRYGEGYDLFDQEYLAFIILLFLMIQIPCLKHPKYLLQIFLTSSHHVIH